MGEFELIKNILSERMLPEIQGKDEMLETILREEYGYLPPKPDKISFSKVEMEKIFFCAGKSTFDIIEITTQFGEKTFSFRVYVCVPTKEGKHAFFVNITFDDAVPNRFLPIEEIIDQGYGVLTFCYKNITSDDGDFENGLAGVLYENGVRGDTDAGKIAMWAWAAHRVLDYAETLDNLDMDCAIVCGHSRLGKTALLAAATDERFKFAYSNNSGCSGAAISRGKVGEDVAFICKTFPFWFCKNYHKYANNEYNMPFDQHYLLASIAPRYIYVASAKEDTWADPVSEMLSCVAVGDVYEKMGKKGFVCDDRLPEVGDEFHDGCVGYHLRAGMHYFSREDWNKAIKFINKHR